MNVQLEVFCSQLEVCRLVSQLGYSRVSLTASRLALPAQT